MFVELKTYGIVSKMLLTQCRWGHYEFFVVAQVADGSSPPDRESSVLKWTTNVLFAGRYHLHLECHDNSTGSSCHRGSTVGFCHHFSHTSTGQADSFSASSPTLNVHKTPRQWNVDHCLWILFFFPLIFSVLCWGAAVMLILLCKKRKICPNGLTLERRGPTRQ